MSLEQHLWYNKNKFIKQIYLQAMQKHEHLLIFMILIFQ